MNGAGFPSWAVFLLERAFPCWANWMIHSTVLAAAGLSLSYAFRKREAAFRSLVLRMTLLGVILCPFITAGVAGIAKRDLTVPMPRCMTISGELARSSARLESAGVTIRPPTLLAWARAEGLVPGPPGAADIRGPSSPVESDRHASRNGWLRFLAVEIVLVSATVSCWLLINLLFAKRLIGAVVAAANEAAPAFAEECARLAERLGVTPPRILLSSLVRSPFIIGVFRPVVLLPSVPGDGDVISREVILHELAHLARHDCFWNLLCRTATTALPFQPLLWLLARRIEETSDDVCDDYVVQHCVDPRSYARRLFHIADRFRSDRYEAAVGLGVVSFRSCLGRRIERLLDDSRHITVKTSVRALIGTAGIAAGLTVVLGFTGIRVRTPENRPDPLSTARRGRPSPVVMKPDVTVAFIPVPVRKPAEATPVETPSPTPSRTAVANATESPAADSPPAESFSADEAVADVEEMIESGDIEKGPDSFVDPESDPVVGEPVLHLTMVSGVPIDTQGVSHAPETVSASQPTGRALTAKPSASALIRVERSRGWYDEAAANVSPAILVPEPVQKGETWIKSLKDLDARMKAGAEALKGGRFDDAEKAFHAALEFAPKDTRIMNALGLIRRAKHDYSGAAKWFGEAVSVNPGDAEASYNLGDMALARGDMDTAMKYYKKAIQLNPAYKNRVRIFF